MMKLYSYFRSSASFRVRIALALKGLDFEVIPINLRSGEQKTSDYRSINPQGFVPALDVGGQCLTQSLAIIEYLDEAYPQIPLLPAKALERAKVRAICGLIACDTHPLNNLQVLDYLTNTLKIDDTQKQAWYAHWIQTSFTALEAMLAQTAGKFCYGDTPTLADCLLVPQVYNAQRFDVDLSAYPTITCVVDNCMKLDAFRQASPANQVDAI